MSSSMTGSTGSMQNSSTGKPWKEKIPKGYNSATIQQFTPDQMKLFQDSFSHVSPDSYLSRLAGGDQGLFQEMEAPAFRQFNEMQGNTASRFSGMGGTGARRSSGFQNYMNQASSNFAQDLQSNRQNLQRQALTDLMGFTNQMLNQRPFERALVEKPQETSWIDTIGKFAGMVPGITSLASGFGLGSSGSSGSSSNGGGYSITGGTNRPTSVKTF